MVLLVVVLVVARNLLAATYKTLSSIPTVHAVSPQRTMSWLSKGLFCRVTFFVYPGMKPSVTGNTRAHPELKRA